VWNWYQYWMYHSPSPKHIVSRFTDLTTNTFKTWRRSTAQHKSLKVKFPLSLSKMPQRLNEEVG
jgi:hypothetical protein